MQSNVVIVFVCLCSVLGRVLCAIIEYDNPVANTAYGQIRGKQYTLSTTGSTSSRRVVAFIGVPYARPPIGYNRFQAPTPPEPWSGETKDCTNNRVMCPQVEQRFNFQPQQQINENEDCLYLNIYVPISSTIGYAQNMPVLVYFHGGEFKYGGKDLFKPDYILENSMIGNSAGVIVITVNYRLGVLGFLSSDDNNNPGNNGIRDQVQALRWVSENIGNFNGNPTNVTIMGHDAGAVSVSMHVLNQESWPFFSAAVSVGGSVFAPWAFKDNPVDQARDFGRFFGCDMMTDRLAECLRNLDVGSLMAKSRERDIDRNTQPYWFRPVIDRNTSAAIIKDYPLALYQSGRYKQCPYIVGFTKDEGSLEFYLQYDKLANKRSIEEKIAFLIRPFLKDWADEDIIASAIKFQYFSRNISRNSMSSQYGSNVPNNPRQNLVNNIRSNSNPYQAAAANYGRGNAYGLVEQEEHRVLIEIMSDFMYIAPMDYVARLHSSLGGQVWMFVFEYEGTKSFGPIQMNAAQVSRMSYGVTHMDDVFYIMPNEYIPDTSSVGNPPERQVANTYSTLMTELIRQNKIPNYNSYGWQQYTAQTPNYLIWVRNAIQPVGHPVQRPSDGYHTISSDFFNGFIFELQERTRRYPTPFPYREYKSYQAATWSLVGFIILLVIILIAIIAVLFVKRQKKNELKLLRKNDKELEERFTST